MFVIFSRLFLCYPSFSVLYAFSGVTGFEFLRSSSFGCAMSSPVSCLCSSVPHFRLPGFLSASVLFPSLFRSRASLSSSPLTSVSGLSGLPISSTFYLTSSLLIHLLPLTCSSFSLSSALQLACFPIPPFFVSLRFLSSSTPFH